MTDTTDTITAPLNPEQVARAGALTIAKDVLMGNAPIFGGQSNGRSPAELIEIADYIVQGTPEPEAPKSGLSFLDFLTAMAEQDGLTLHGPDCECEPVADPDEDPAVRVQQAEAVARDSRKRQEEREQFWADTPERAAKLRDAAEEAEAAARVAAALTGVPVLTAADDVDLDAL